MSEEQERVVIPDEQGEEHLFDILFTFDVDETERSYMVVKPVEPDNDTDDQEEEVYAFRFEEEGDDFNLFPVETDKEWDMIEEMLNTFVEEGHV
ncbi:DUF1292 domain-containing protein [Tuberibacillus sp. Marseille-P3662]|uniref:DUF1292 domain-containing protein n=1 Tax=Tuberibacillus sp. Marseille-P3662 TaxID=1965358 RepID=UPI000A1CB0CC|nr:DUF1292 domain-containing protein [Tuberibacillus sp. Marseille-P3662]